MYILNRYISPYTANNLFLGIFDSEHLAEKAREEYILSISSEDPWAKQAYYEPNPAKDTSILAVEDKRNNSESTKVFLVTSYFEGMGQGVIRYDAVFCTINEAEEFAELLENNDENQPNWCEVNEVFVNQHIKN